MDNVLNFVWWKIVVMIYVKFIDFKIIGLVEFDIIDFMIYVKEKRVVGFKVMFIYIFVLVIVWVIKVGILEMNIFICCGCVVIYFSIDVMISVLLFGG